MSHIPFNVACQLWEADKQAYVKASSMAAYSLTVEKHLKPNFAYLQDVSPDRVQELVDEAVDKGMTLSTLKGILVVLKMILRYSEKRGWDRRSHAGCQVSAKSQTQESALRPSGQGREEADGIPCRPPDQHEHRTADLPLLRTQDR